MPASTGAPAKCRVLHLCAVPYRPHARAGPAHPLCPPPQVYADDALLREKQRLYDTYDATLRKSGLSELLDMPLPKASK